MSPVGGVIKKEYVKVGGTCAVAPVAAHPAASAGCGAGGSARLVQQAEGYAIVEIVCSCGRRMELRCELAK